MKKLFVIVAILISVSSFAQPKKSGTSAAEKIPTLETIEVKGNHRIDTFNVMVVFEEAEGYLKRIAGKLVVKSFVSVQGATSVVEQKVFDNKWVAIKQDMIFDIKQIPKGQ